MKIAHLIVAALLIAGIPAPALAQQKPLVTMGGQTKPLPPSTTLATQPATTGSASLSIPAGTPPVAPNDGDCWTTALQLSCRVGGNLFGSVTSGFGNPTIAGGFFALNDPASKTSQSDTYTLSGTRDKAWIGRSISLNDNANSPAAGPATASYGMSIFGQRPNWNTSSITGEMDGLTIALRQATGDSAAILSNILTRNGFGATLESYTAAADVTGAVTKAVNVQLGVANSRDNNYYGISLTSANGTGLNAAIRIQQLPGTSWSNALELIAPDGATTLARIRAADGAFIGGTLAPAANLGANIGGPGSIYANIYTRNLALDKQVYASLPACGTSTDGVSAYIADSAAPFLKSGIAVSGGGSNKMMVRCDGSAWLATAGDAPASPPECVNLMYYGADRTGATASDAAWNVAVAATTPGQQCVYAPAGTYKFTSPKSFNTSSSFPQGSVLVKGDGQEVTLFNFASGTSGFAFTMNSAFQSVHGHGFSVLGGVYGSSTTGIAVYQAASVPNPAYTAISDFTGVTVRGNDGYAQSNGFGTGISVNRASNVNIVNDYVTGPGSASGTCLSLNGDVTDIAVVFNLIGTTLNSCATALYYGSYVQGVSVVSSNMTGNRTGIYVPASAPEVSQLAVTSSQFANIDFDINLQMDPGGTTISNNFFLANSSATAGNARINIAAAKNTSIFGNVLQGIGTINGIVVQSYTAPWSMYIGQNALNQFNTALWLQGGTQKVTVGTNTFGGNTTDILNTGTGNIVPTSCSAAPTSGFRVTNGVITAC